MHRTTTPAPDEHRPSPLGLLFLGLTAAIFNLHALELFPLSTVILGSGMLYGSLGQVAVGLVELRRGHSAFGTIAFTGLGLFWLSLIGLAVLPVAGIGEVPAPAAMTAYLAIWGLFTLILFLGTFRLDRSLRLVFGALLLFFFLLPAGVAAGDTLLRTLAAWSGVCGGLAATVTGVVELLTAAHSRPLAPLGMEAHKRA